MHQPILMTNSRSVRLPRQQQQLAHLRQAANRCCCGSVASSSRCSAFSDEAIASVKVLRTVPLTSKINTSWTNWDTVSLLLCRGETLPLYPYSSSSFFLLESVMRTRSSSPGSISFHHKFVLPCFCCRGTMWRVLIGTLWIFASFFSRTAVV